VAPFSWLASDRFSRNFVVATSQALLLVNAIVLAFVIAMGWLEVWHLFAFAIVGGVLNAFNNPARQSLVFDVVPRAVVPNAVALSNLAFSSLRTVGPMVGGGLIALFGPADNFVVQAVMYACVFWTALLIRVPKRPASNTPKHFYRDLVEGYRWALSHRETRILLLMLTLYPTFVIPLHNALMPVFAKDVFHEGSSALGLLLGALGAGGIVGGLLAASLNRVDRRGLLQLYAFFVSSLGQTGFAVFGYLTGSLWVGVFMLFLAGIGGSLFNTTNQTVVQLIAPGPPAGAHHQRHAGAAAVHGGGHAERRLPGRLLRRRRRDRRVQLHGVLHRLKRARVLATHAIAAPEPNRNDDRRLSRNQRGNHTIVSRTFAFLAYFPGLAVLYLVAAAIRRRWHRHPPARRARPRSLRRPRRHSRWR